MWIRHLSDVLDKLIRILVMVLLSLMFLNVFGTAVIRYLLKLSFVGSYDYSRILFIWSTFLGASVVYKLKGHARFVFVHMRTKGGVRLALDSITSVLSIVFFAIILTVGIKLCISTSVQKLPASGISAVWLYVPVVLSALVMLIHELVFSFTELFSSSKQDAKSGGTIIEGVNNV